MAIVRFTADDFEGLDDSPYITDSALWMACREMAEMFEGRCPDYAECGHTVDNPATAPWVCLKKYFIKKAKER